ncbi:MAG: hypothetical protein K0A93_02685 [Desulfuromonadaceae bacterium]|nr:hypothetical protein [Desulfuromonadaceae bacterium]
MPRNETTSQLLDTNAYNIETLEDEIRADQLCTELLKRFCHELIDNDAADPEEASKLARGAAYFLCEFVIPHCRKNIFQIDPRTVRQFAGNWYIVNNLEPNLPELTELLTGVMGFYYYCEQIGKIDRATRDEISAQCRELDFYQQRIESFLDLVGDGFFAWNDACQPTDQNEDHVYKP